MNAQKTVKEKLKKYVLDTSAILSLLKAEEGADRVEKLLGKAIVMECELNVSVVSLIEIYYNACYEKSDDLAKERLYVVREFQLFVEKFDDREIQIIGSMKAKYKMSFADSCIAGLAQRYNATLIHKDPEFEQLIGVIELEALPYKKKLNKNV